MGFFLARLHLFFLAKTVLPTVARIAPKVVAPLATGALSGLASTGVSKIFGNGLTLPAQPAKQQELLNKAGLYLTNAQINQVLKSNKLKLTKNKTNTMDFAFISSCPMIISRPSIYLSWFGPELFCLLLGPSGFNCWFSFAPVFQWCCSAPRGSPGVGRNTFLSSPHLCFIIVFICDLFVFRDDPLMS